MFFAENIILLYVYFIILLYVEKLYFTHKGTFNFRHENKLIIAKELLCVDKSCMQNNKNVTTIWLFIHRL
jgi:hypothetical protein